MKVSRNYLNNHIAYMGGEYPKGGDIPRIFAALLRRGANLLEGGGESPVTGMCRSSENRLIRYTTNFGAKFVIYNITRRIKNGRQILMMLPMETAWLCFHGNVKKC